MSHEWQGVPTLCVAVYVELQVEEFLEEWKMPDSGQKTLPLMHKLKALAGIVEPKRDRANSEL